LCKLQLAFGRALKRTNPAALASFAVGIPGAGLAGADFIANWLDLRHRVSLPHGWPRNAYLIESRERKCPDFFAIQCIWAAGYRVKSNAWPINGAQTVRFVRRK
jgi:hypothetical protein